MRRPRHAIPLAPVPARQQRGIDRNERRGESAFAEKILEEVRNPKRRVECVRRIGFETEVVRKRAEPNETRKPAQQDSRSYEDCRPARAFHSVIVNSVS